MLPGLVAGELLDCPAAGFWMTAAAKLIQSIRMPGWPVRKTWGSTVALCPKGGHRENRDANWH